LESPAAVTYSHKALKSFAVVLLALLLLWPLTFGMVWLLNKGYTWLDPTRFPFPSPESTRSCKALRRKLPNLKKAPR